MFNEMFDEEKDQAPNLGEILKGASSTPPTDYSFYKNISAEDRAKLAADLMAKQHSGGNAIASGIAGIGDAISNSYGGKNTAFQKGVEDKAQKTTDQTLSNFDTQRGQKMQDFTADTQMQESDPNSPMSIQMRDFFKSNGVEVPSGMSATHLSKLAPAMADLVKSKYEQSFKESQLSAQNNQNNASNSMREREITRQEALDAAATASKGDAKRMEAAEGLQKRPWYQKIAEAPFVPLPKSQATEEMERVLNGNQMEGNGWTIKLKKAK